MRTSRLVAAVSLVTACGAPSRAPLTLGWTFDGGLTCAQAGVATIQVDVAGEVLTPNRFACQSGAAVNTGADLGSYLLGTYDVTVSGLDSTNTVVYQGRKQVLVKAGGTSDTIDARSGSATLRWTFAGKSCAAAGVTSVRAAVDGQPLADASNNLDLPCSQGGVDGVTVAPLVAGTHTFDLTGLVNGRVAYQLNGLQIGVALAQDSAASPDLRVSAPTTGTADLRWSFAGGMTCAEAQVDAVQVTYDPSANGTGGTDLGKVPCTNGGLDGVLFDGVAPGSHTFAIAGLRNVSTGSRLVYQSAASAGAPFQAGVTTKVLLDAGAAPPGKGGIALTWQFPAGRTCGGASSVTYTLTDPLGRRSALYSAGCSGGAANGVDSCWTGAPTQSCPGLIPGLWTIDANAGNTAAHGVLFAVPNDAHAAATIQFQ